MDEATAARNTAACEAALTQGHEVARAIIADLAAIFDRIDHTPGASVADALMEIVTDELPQLAHPWSDNLEAIGALAAALFPCVSAAQPRMEMGEWAPPPGGGFHWRMGANEALLTAGTCGDLALRAAGVGMKSLDSAPLLLICAAALAAHRKPVRREFASNGRPSRRLRRQHPPRKAVADVAHGGPATIPTQRVA